MDYYWEHPKCGGSGNVELKSIPENWVCPNCATKIMVQPFPYPPFIKIARPREAHED